MKNILDDKVRKFADSLSNAQISDVIFGEIENKLFGDGSNVIDANGVRNSKIKIFYFIRKARQPGAPFIVFLNGGPGIAATDMFLQYEYHQFLPEFNIVFFDQRGTGLSHRCSDDVRELQYYSAKYIISDAEKIRENILGHNSKWIVFGQSFGGMVAKKYVEYNPASMTQVVTHGSGRYDAVASAVNTEIITAERLTRYFEKFPDDLQIVEAIRSALSESDILESDLFRIKGTAFLDLLSILYTVKSDEDLHAFFGKMNTKHPKDSFLTAIRPLAELVLKAGLLNQAVAQTNLIGELNSQQVCLKAREILIAKNIDVNKSIISKMRFDGGLEPVSSGLLTLEKLFEEKIFRGDLLDYEKIVRNAEHNNIRLDVFGGESDALAFEAIRAEEEVVRSYAATTCFNFHYSQGHHREWLSNDTLFADVLKVGS